MSTGRKSAGGKEEEEMALPVKSCRVSERIWAWNAWEQYGALWPVCACLNVWVCVWIKAGRVVSASVMSEREKQRIWAGCSHNAQMRQWRSMTLKLQTSICVCLAELPVKGAESVRLSAHTLTDQVSLLENVTGGEESASQQATEIEGWKSGCECLVKRPDIKQRFECFLCLPSPFLLQNIEAWKRVYYFLFVCISLCLATCFGSLDESILLSSISLSYSYRKRQILPFATHPFKAADYFCVLKDRKSLKVK